MDVERQSPVTGPHPTLSSDFGGHDMLSFDPTLTSSFSRGASGVFPSLDRLVFPLVGRSITMRKRVLAGGLIVVALAGPTRAHAQQWALGGYAGVSRLSESAGLQIAPTVEVFFTRQFAVGTEISVNTQYGAPMMWHAYAKYRLVLGRSRVAPFASVGPTVAFNIPNGPSFGLLFGGGVEIPVGDGLSVAPNIVAGPIFGVGGGVRPLVMTGWYWGYFTSGLTTYTVPSTTILALSVRVGLRYEL